MQGRDCVLEVFSSEQTTDFQDARQTYMMMAPPIDQLWLDAGKFYEIKMYGTCQLVSQRWKKETGDWFDLERFQYLPLRRKFARCKEPEDLQCLRRLLQLPNVFIRQEHLEEMREKSTGAPEQDDFIIDLLKSIGDTRPLIPACYYLSQRVLVFFGLTLVRRDQVELMRSLLNDRIIRTCMTTATEVVRCGSTQMFALLAKQGNISHELFVAVKAAHHRDFLLHIAKIFAAWKDPACFEILDKNLPYGWDTVAGRLLEAEDLPDNMYRRLLELIRNMYSSFVLFDLLKIMIRERPFHSGYNNAALCEAVKRLNVEMVKLLLRSRKIDRDVQREMMMEEASKAGNEEILRLLNKPARRKQNKCKTM
ncbi:hypothetical protein PROFUN_07724 [Planoprotostelium fungivorum]|uniref:Uncharacterized protein n=1 Tax=Planoprotostelium fungivorum TaxID=1890364 RepID=A0A2P6N1D7_9EUKA|nr:hypothetical protein PROFUN_07724 [Planoprotostelium fungivorum]